MRGSLLVLFVIGVVWTARAQAESFCCANPLDFVGQGTVLPRATHHDVGDNDMGDNRYTDMAFSLDGGVYAYALVNQHRVVVQRRNDKFTLDISDFTTDKIKRCSLSLNLNGSLLALVNQRGNVALYAIGTAAKRIYTTTLPDITPSASLTLALSPVGDKLIVSYDGIAILYDISKSGLLVPRNKLKAASPLNRMAYFDSELFLGANIKGEIRLYHFGLGRIQNPPPFDTMPELCVLTCDNSKYCIAANTYGEMKLWDLYDPGKPQLLEITTERVHTLLAVAFDHIDVSGPAPIIRIKGLDAEHRLVFMDLAIHGPSPPQERERMARGQQQKAVREQQKHVRDDYNYLLSFMPKAQPALQAVRAVQKRLTPLADQIRTAHLNANDRADLSAEYASLQRQLNALAPRAQNAVTKSERIQPILDALKRDGADAWRNQPITDTTDLQALTAHLNTLSVALNNLAPDLQQAHVDADAVLAGLAPTADLHRRLDTLENAIKAALQPRSFVFDPNAKPNPQLQLDAALVNQVIFDPVNSNWLVTADKQGKVQWWDAKTGKPAQSYAHHDAANAPDAANALAFGADGGLLASGGSDKQVRLWQVVEAHEFQSSLPHPGVVRAVAFAPGGKVLASGIVVDADQTHADRHGRVLFWDLSRPERPQHLEGKDLSLSDAVNVLVYSPTGNSLAVGCNDDIYVYKVDSEKAQENTKRHLTAPGDTAIFSLVFLDEDTVLSFKGDMVYEWNLKKTGLVLQPTRSWKADRELRSLAYCPSRKLLAAGARDGSLLVWDLTGAQAPYPQLPLPKAHPGPVVSVAFDATGDQLVSASRDKTVRCWNVWNWSR